MMSSDFMTASYLKGVLISIKTPFSASISIYLSNPLESQTDREIF